MKPEHLDAQISYENQSVELYNYRKCWLNIVFQLKPLSYLPISREFYDKSE